MSGPIATLVCSLYEHIARTLEDGGYPALVDGRILLGRVAQYQQSAPPRIIMVPLGSEFSPVDPSSASMEFSSTERRSQRAQRPLETEALAFEVRCWGVSATQDPADDFDVTRALYHAFRSALYARTGNSFSMTDKGTFTNATFAASQVISLGREYVFSFALQTPVLDKLYRLSPSDVTAKPVTSMQSPTGSTNVGCGG